MRRKPDREGGPSVGSGKGAQKEFKVESSEFRIAGAVVAGPLNCELCTVNFFRTCRECARSSCNVPSQPPARDNPNSDPSIRSPLVVWVEKQVFLAGFHAARRTRTTWRAARMARGAAPRFAPAGRRVVATGGAEAWRSPPTRNPWKGCPLMRAAPDGAEEGAAYAGEHRWSPTCPSQTFSSSTRFAKASASACVVFVRSVQNSDRLAASGASFGHPPSSALTTV